MIALIFLKQDEPGASRTRSMLVAVLAFLYSLLVIIGAGAETVFYGFILLTAAMPFYVLVPRNKTIRHEATNELKTSAAPK